MTWKDAKWIGVPESEIKKRNILHGDMNGRFAYYRLELELDDVVSSEISITANSRYRLWVNGRAILSGPCKGDRYRHYFEQIDITEYLKDGRNVLAVQVLFCDSNTVAHQYNERSPLFSVLSLPVGHLLAVEGVVRNEGGRKSVDVTTGRAGWRVYLDRSFYLKSDETTMNLGAILEEIDMHKQPPGWKIENFDMKKWEKPFEWGAVVPSKFDERVGLYGAFRLYEREIPLLYEKEHEFCQTKNLNPLFDKGFIVIEPKSQYEFVLDAGEHINAYLQYAFKKGADTEITITYSEKYSDSKKEIRRTDSVNGELKGITDRVILRGEYEMYEPFWVRTFRFINIEICTKGEELLFYLPKALRTGYPLEIETTIKSSTPWVEKLWQICLRTLENCMMETYMDCPFYEQMQFIMDTRLQALFTYVVSNDVDLVKKALKDFHYSMLPEGLIQGKYPSSFPQIISTFSLHYIFMLEEYYRHTGDKRMIRDYRTDVDNILAYYDKKLGKTGLIEKLGFWEFVDWQDAWKEDMGVPTAALRGPSTIINLMYAYALNSGAYIQEMTGRLEVAKEYQERKKAILNHIQIQCWDEKVGLYREGPELKQYSQHAQAWAILNGMVTQEAGKEILRRTLDNPDVLQCSFSTGYELFRAFEQVGDYKSTQNLMDKWIRLIELECTTCPEEPEMGRSECHAWSALPLYELIRSVAGVQSGEDGWKSVVIKPHMDYVDQISGNVITPKGSVHIEFNKINGQYQVYIPDGLNGIFVLPDGSERKIEGGLTQIEIS